MLTPSTRITQHSGHRIFLEPSVEPVSLDSFKEQIKITDSDDDTFLTSCLLQARAALETYYGLAFIQQSWTLILDRWPGGEEQWWDGVRSLPISELYQGSKLPIVFPRFPLSSVDSISVFGLDDVEETVELATIFHVDTYSHPGRMTLRSGQTWPVAMREVNAIQIRYTAGFGSTIHSVPEVLKRAIYNLASFFYSKRGDECSTEMAIKKSGAGFLCGEYKRVRL